MQTPRCLEEVNSVSQAESAATSNASSRAGHQVSLLSKPTILIVVEGINDMQFLRHISRLLHDDRPALPDLAVMEQGGEVLFIPVGGSDLRHWFKRLAVFGCQEFHLFDREIAPVMAARHEAARLVNQRAGCRAFVTKKRALENYLHPAAIRDCNAIDVTLTDEDDVADLVARACTALREPSLEWSTLPARFRKRLRYRAKRWLNTCAVQQMSIARLAEVDPRDEIISWLKAIGELIS